ncbi:hypothetical protein LNU06_06975 [Campylobacter sp. VicNov18]|nr:hypothetical protein [Campylobacter bilis]MCC8278414.1 hypothetical protein [Campylobacter bilis]MCC8299918.1 hypothetical protein [Campylobacter bilis]MCC8301323.1 hypothetical protein [Campylobacter bilis]MCC8350486.1 hypothetical protein [Campylobacter bilis]MCC8356100.1 hypothetical protein [Campylobacter bilis]
MSMLDIFEIIFIFIVVIISFGGMIFAIRKEKK